MYGYYNNYARVDLTTGTVTKQSFSEETFRKYIGGTGIGTYILFNETDKDTDPLGPENVLTFNTGPLVGTKAPNFGRIHVVAKSPLTDRYGEADAGGQFGPAVRKAGFDGLIITGKAEKPVYIVLNNSEVKIKDASPLWGKDTFECDEILRAEYGKTAVTANIGITGEKLSKMAAIMTGGKSARPAARGGLGAVMGSKNLKAIVAYGDMKAPTANEDEFKKFCVKWAKDLKAALGIVHDYGTACSFENSVVTGDAPIKNWTEGEFPGEKISGPTMAQTILTGRYYCAQCVVGCGREVKTEGKYKMAGAGPEYETLGMLGSNLMIDDLSAISYCHELCNIYGFDLISAGGTVAFAIEAYEKGYIKKEDLGGLELKWGDPDCVIALLGKMARREDLGNLLADGSKVAGEALGALHLTVQIKGMECPAHDPRAAHAVALEYMTSPRGACHVSAFTHDFELMGGGPVMDFPFEAFNRFGREGKAEMVAQFQDLMAIADSICICKFAVFAFGEMAQVLCDFLNYVTGWDVKPEELMLTGERIMNLKHLYNIKCGWQPAEDVLPHKILAYHRGTGGAANNLPDIGFMLNAYNKYRGRDQYGFPKKETLEKLGLANLC